MKSFALLLFSILFYSSSFSQMGVYLFGSMDNAPGNTFEVSVIIYSNPPVTTQLTVNPDGSMTNGGGNWVSLPSSEWTHFEVIYPTCNNEANILTVNADSLPNMIDVFFTVDYCPAGNEIYGCTDPEAINFNPQANVNDGSCEYETTCTPMAMIIDGPSIGQGTWDLFETNGQYIQSGSYTGSAQTYDLCLEDGCYELFFVLNDGNPITDQVFYSIFQEDSLIDFGIFYDQTNLAQFGVNANCDSTNLIYGCTNPSATNYNPNANVDDGSCIFNEVGNDLCADATELQPGTQLISNVGAVNNENVWGECWAFGSGEGEQTSIWYSFTTPNEPASIHIEASGDGTNTLTDTQFGLFEECGGEMIYCDGNAGQGLFSAFHFECGELEENTTYILMIDGYFGDNGTCNLTYEVETGCDQISGCTDPSAINYNPLATFDDGSCIYQDSCAANTVLIELNTSIWGEEISWNLYNENTLVASSGIYQSDASYLDVLCLEDGCYTLEMFDSFGDGWNGAQISISIAGQNGYLATGTLNSGEFGTLDFSINAECESIEECGEIYFEALLPGDSTMGCTALLQAFYNGENQSGILTWDFGDGNPVQGNTWIAQYEFTENGSYPVCVTYTTDNCSVTWCDWIDIAGCDSEVYGCTDPAAINYNPNATVNDGSCQYTDSCFTNLALLQINTELWGAEISWSLFNDGNEIASGDGYGNNYTYNQYLCLEDGCYTIELYDSWGDGWNGGTFALSIDGETVVSGTLDNGEFGYFDFGINTEGCVIEISGCTDPEATNFNPLATIDDGSCEYETACTSVTMILDGPSNNQGFFDLYSSNGYLLNDGYSGSDQTYEWCLEDGCYELFFITNGGVVSDEIYFTIFQEDSLITAGTIVDQTSIINFGVNDDCNPTEVYGCTDPDATNYNPSATADDGSCEYEFECGISFTVSPDTTGGNVIWITPSNNIFNAVEVLWDFGDGNTSTDLFPTHSYDGDGPYMLCLTAFFQNPSSPDYCSITYCAELTNEMINPPGFQSSGFSINIVNPSGVTGLDEVPQITGLNLWPNPTNQFAQLEWTMNTGENVTIALFDLAGRQAQAHSLAASAGKNLYPIDATELPAGIYVVRIFGQEHQSTTKLIKH